MLCAARLACPRLKAVVCSLAASLQWLKKYAALVRFVTAEEVRREYFTPETCPEEFRDKPFLR